MKLITVSIPEYLDSKRAMVFLAKQESSSWWFELPDGKIMVVDHIPYNWPQMTIAFYKNKEKALKRIKEMVEKEGWEIERGSLD